MAASRPELIQWKPAPVDWCTLDSDGAVHNSSSLGSVGGLIRNNAGDWIVGFNKSVGVTTPLQAELWGIFEGLNLALGCWILSLFVVKQILRLTAMPNFLQPLMASFASSLMHPKKSPPILPGTCMVLGFCWAMSAEAIADWRKLFAAGRILEWIYALVGQFIGSTPNFGTLQKVIELMWGKAAPVKVSLAGSNLFVFSFANASTRDWVLKNVVQCPLELFSRKGLSYIASAIGKPLHMDSITTSRERIEYARVTVPWKPAPYDACGSDTTVAGVKIDNAPTEQNGNLKEVIYDANPGGNVDVHYVQIALSLVDTVGKYCKDNDRVNSGKEVAKEVNQATHVEALNTENGSNPPIKRGRARPTKDGGKGAIVGLKNKFEVLNSIDPKSLLATEDSNFSDWNSCCNYNHSTNGRIWMLWHSSLSCTILYVFDQSISMKGNLSWIIGGDFNIILNAEESSTTAPAVGNPAQILFHKLKKAKLANLNSAHIGNNITSELEVGKKLQVLEEAKLLFYKQKAKVDWINEGDQGTHFFHSMMASNRKTNTIRVLYNKARLRLDTFEDLSNEVISFFPNAAREIMEAVWGQGNEKSPGPNGYNPFFFKSAWSVISDEFKSSIRYCFDNSFILHAFNTTVVVLEKKVPNPNMGRSIVDNTLLAQELVRGYNRKNISPREITGFKIAKLPVRYLGIPLVTKKMAEKDCQCLIEKIRAKLNLHVMLPLVVIKRIEQLCSRFFWKGGWNKAFFAKLVKNLLAEDESLWVAWIHFYMIKDADFLQMMNLARDRSGKTCGSQKIRLPTRVRLLRMGLAIENDKCLLCSIKPETRDHIFFECGLTNALWGAILSLRGVNRNVSSWNGELAWAIHCFKGKSLIVRVLKLALAGYAYSIWKERNNILFGGKARLMRYILEDIREIIRIQFSGWSIDRVDSRNVALCVNWGIPCQSSAFLGNEIDYPKKIILQKQYEDVKMRIETTTKLNRIPQHIRKQHEGFREWDFVSSKRDQQTILQILIDGRDPNAWDIEGNPLPTRVFVKREKTPTSPPFQSWIHECAYQAIIKDNNSPIILNVDCDMYSDNSESIKYSLCLFMDEEKGDEIAFIQFPQNFDNLTKNDIYGSCLRVEVQGLDANGEPCYIGTGCFHRREALCGKKYEKNYKVDWTKLNDTKVEDNASLLEETSKVLASYGFSIRLLVEDIVTAPCCMDTKRSLLGFGLLTVLAVSGLQTDWRRCIMPLFHAFACLKASHCSPRYRALWVLPFAYVAFSHRAYSLSEFVWCGGTFMSWCNDQRMWCNHLEAVRMFDILATLAMLNLLGMLGAIKKVIISNVLECKFSSAWLW
ncbi:hypothetical protein F3Y22_tig00113096pilonHSYRG00099 [Hibiscus syriacus]|uniref:Reverse transcriptase zinc-binding domain-containing protein n=1 Tax=Hibiscus syriacus TaxID=106335 RepID=A0A6A2WQF1_HIBSY|nr:hypothetical protein F3Y22_tig00113096pilonHSYRG00099 [Hibiscus syriacus]